MTGILDFLAGCARRVDLHPGDRRREGGWLGVVIAGANVNDFKLLEATLKAIDRVRALRSPP